MVTILNNPMIQTNTCGNGHSIQYIPLKIEVTQNKIFMSKNIQTTNNWQICKFSSAQQQNTTRLPIRIYVQYSTHSLGECVCIDICLSQLLLLGILIHSLDGRIAKHASMHSSKHHHCGVDIKQAGDKYATINVIHRGHGNVNSSTN